MLCYASALLLHVRGGRAGAAFLCPAIMLPAIVLTGAAGASRIVLRLVGAAPAPTWPFWPGPGCYPLYAGGSCWPSLRRRSMCSMRSRCATCSGLRQSMSPQPAAAAAAASSAASRGSSGGCCCCGSWCCCWCCGGCCPPAAAAAPCPVCWLTGRSGSPPGSSVWAAGGPASGCLTGPTGPSPAAAHAAGSATAAAGVPGGGCRSVDVLRVPACLCNTAAAAVAAPRWRTSATPPTPLACLLALRSSQVTTCGRGPGAGGQ